MRLLLVSVIHYVKYVMYNKHPIPTTHSGKKKKEDQENIFLQCAAKLHR